MNTYNIVHISATPLVGAPSKIAYIQSKVGHRSSHVCLSDYPSEGPLSNKFIIHSLIPSDQTQSLIENKIAEADIIHVHNQLPTTWCKQLLQLNQQANYIYQVHSPLREGPLYLDRADYLNLPFTKKLVVGQFCSRLYPSYIQVPNLIIDKPSIKYHNKKYKLRILFSPTHNQSGRWNSKYCLQLINTLQHLHGLKKIDLVKIDKPVSPYTLMSLRRECDITIDEINTGGFHQVSLEGLCASNVTINKADFFSRYSFAQFTEQQPPPFYYADSTNILERLEYLITDSNKVNEIKQASYNYFKQYLLPERLVRFFDNAYVEC